jgi:hypothetical protein
VTDTLKQHLEPASPLEVIENFETIVRRERLVRGSYGEPPKMIHDPEHRQIAEELRDAGAICGGIQACAIGTLWLAARVRLNFAEGTDWAVPNWMGEHERPKAIEETPHLGEALDALNAAATDYMDELDPVRHPWVRRALADDIWIDPLEGLFEEPGIEDIRAMPHANINTLDSGPSARWGVSQALAPILLHIAEQAKELLPAMDR